MKKILLLISLLPILLKVSAQAGRLDSSFGINGSYRTGSQFNWRALQTDGKLIGLQILSNSFSLTRYNTNGIVDATFGSGGTVTVLIPGMANNTGGGVEIQKNNNSIVIIVNGRNYTNDSTLVAITKFFSDGSIDTTFGNHGMGIEKFYYAPTPPGGIDPVSPAGIRVFAVKDDGTIVALAQYSGFRQSYFSIDYYSSDGSKSAISKTVQYPYYYYTVPRVIAISDDGKVEAGGSAEGPGSQPPGLSIFAGYSDFTYSNYPFGTNLNGMAMQNDGKLIVIDSYRLVRFNINGTLDSTFGTAGVATISFFGNSIRLLPEGKILVGGGGGGGDFALARYNLNGIIDASFGNGGLIRTEFVILDMLVADNRVYALGSDSVRNGVVAAYLLASNTTTCTPPTFKNDGTIVLDASCGNDDGQISIIPTSGTAPFMYSIDGGATYEAGANTGTGFTDLAHGTYKLRLKDANGCESAIVEKTVRSYYGGPSFLNNGQIVLDASCGNSDGNITIQPTCGVGPFMYSIDGGTTYVSGPDAGYTFGNLAPGTYKLRLKDIEGRESAIVERELKTLYEPPSFLNNGQIVLDASCANNDGNITIQPTSGNGPFMYSINGGATYVSGSNTGYTFANLTSGTYQLMLKAANGCESAIVERRVALNCTTTCTPPAFLNNSMTVLDASCANNDGNVTIEPATGTGPFMYSKDGGTTYVSGPNYGYTFGNLSAGNYNLRLKDALGCQSPVVEKTVNIVYGTPCAQSATAAVITATGVAVQRDALLAYPNPTSGQFKLQLKNFISPKAEVSVYNGEGKLIQKRQLNLAGTSTIDCDLTGKAPGIYYIKITSNSGTRTSKVLVQ